MYIHFRYRNGSNPYITTTNKNLFKMICKYELMEIQPKTFEVIHKRQPYKKTYKALREVLRDFAICWQWFFPAMDYDSQDLADYGAFFEEYGKKYGLLREFRENGII